MHTFVVHYSEIGIKGANRYRFERALAANIKAILDGKRSIVRHFHGRLILRTTVAPTEVVARLKCVPGIAHFAPAQLRPLEVKRVRECCVDLASAAAGATFGVRVRRANKGFAVSSMEMERQIGSAIQESTGRAVDLTAPDLWIRVELTRREAIIYHDRIEGCGGLPVGMAGSVVVLLSGGIDSPVAAYKLIRRGCRAVLVHFHNTTQHAEQVRSKLFDLAAVLARHQLSSRLYLVPFADIQAAIVTRVPPAARMLSYRRSMLQVGETILQREGALGFVTGDCLGQVASQTLDNLAAISAATTRPILQPLIGDDKEAIKALARTIGTYDISVRPYEDCCSFMIARHPDTSTRLDKLLRLEAGIPHQELAAAAIAHASVHDVAHDFGELRGSVRPATGATGSSLVAPTNATDRP